MPHTFETGKELKGTVAELTRRTKARSIVFKAILSVMAHFGIGDDEAYRLLRTESMNQRVSVEDLSELIASNGENELNRLAIRNKGSLRQVNRR